MLDRLDRALVRANSILAAVTLAVMVTLVFINVVSRYVFDFSFSWVEELTRYMMIWLAYFCAGLALRHKNHVSVEILQDLLPRRTVPLIRGVVAAGILLFFGMIVVYGFEYAAFAWNQVTPVMQLPLGLIYLAMPLGSILMIVHLLLVLRPFVFRTLGADVVIQQDSAAVPAGKDAP